jgi:hypothetical protein
MELKERTPPSNARYKEAGEIELADGTFIAIFRYPEGKIRVQMKHPAADRGRFAVVHLASEDGPNQGTQIMLEPFNNMD